MMRVLCVWFAFRIFLFPFFSLLHFAFAPFYSFSIIIVVISTSSTTHQTANYCGRAHALCTSNIITLVCGPRHVKTRLTQLTITKQCAPSEKRERQAAATAAKKGNIKWKKHQDIELLTFMSAWWAAALDEQQLWCATASWMMSIRALAAGLPPVYLSIYYLLVLLLLANVLFQPHMVATLPACLSFSNILL